MLIFSPLRNKVPSINQSVSVCLSVCLSPSLSLSVSLSLCLSLSLSFSVSLSQNSPHHHTWCPTAIVLAIHRHIHIVTLQFVTGHSWYTHRICDISDYCPIRVRNSTEAVLRWRRHGFIQWLEIHPLLLIVKVFCKWTTTVHAVIHKASEHTV